MMKNSSKILSSGLLTLLFLFMALPAAAQSYNYTIDIVKSDKPPSKRLLAKNQWKKFLKTDGAVVLDSMQGAAVFDQYSLVHEGYKTPISYRDPRAGAYQVQYLDLGLKIDIRVKPQTDGTLFVEARSERSVASPIPEHPKRSSAIVCETGVVLKSGQTVVFAAMRGVMNLKYLKPHFPDLPINDSDYLLMVITID